MTIQSYLPVFVLLPILLPWLGALLVWLLGDERARAQHATAAALSIAAGLSSLLLIPYVSSSPAIRIAMGSIFGDFTLTPDGLGLFLTAVATIIGSLAVIFSIDYMRGEAQLGRYYSLVLIFIGAMSGLVLSSSLLLLFIFWEITAFCSYALIAFHNDDPKAVAGGVKALIITQIGGIGLLAGALAVWATLGDYQFSTLLAAAQEMPPALLALAAYGFLLAAAAKSAQAPLHTWLPDAMEAPTPVSALIHAATMVNAGVYLLARFYPAFATVPGWTTAVIAIGVVSIVLAGLMALTATDLKRVLAYSTVSQLGYMVYAVGVGAIFASQFHLFSHAIFKALLFLGAGAIIHTVGTRNMGQMGSVWVQMRFVGVVFTIGAAALAGLPIFNGFWSKELVLEMGLAYGPGWAYAGALLGAGVTALYTIRMVWLVLFANSHSQLEPIHHHPMPAMRTALAPLALGAVATWLLAGPFAHWLDRSLPFHQLHAASTWALVVEIVTAPVTYLALGVVIAGLTAWQQRDKLAGVQARLAWLSRAAVRGFGFEWVNGRFVRLTQRTASALQTTQTGQLSWNLVGIVAGLLFVLVLMGVSSG